MRDERVIDRKKYICDCGGHLVLTGVAGGYDGEIIFDMRCVDCRIYAMKEEQYPLKDHWIVRVLNQYIELSE